MELKTWLLVVRILNCLCAAMLVGFQIWFIIALIQSNKSVYGVILRIWAPIFIILFAFLILSAEFKYEKIVENFKFLQWLPGVAIFNLFMASVLAFEFSMIDETASIVLASLFIALALVFLIVNCLKPPGSSGLLSEE